MKFYEVSKVMDEGKKIKLKDWDNAYWYKKGGIIINHDEEGFECDAREIFPYDLMWVANGDWEIVVENLTPMNFKEAFKLMKQGYPVKLPSWGGYWYWDAAKETIVMHTKDGRELDIRETKRVEYTTLNILSDEWVLASTKNCPADLDSGNVFWFPVHLETGTGSLGYLSDYQEHFYKKLRRINNNGKHL